MHERLEESTLCPHFKRDYENPFCDYVWNETYMKWELDK